MLDIDSTELRHLLGTAAILRGQGKYEDASKLVEGRIGEMNDEAKQAAYLQLIYSNLECGNRKKVKSYVDLLAEYDPNIPTVKKIKSGQWPT